MDALLLNGRASRIDRIEIVPLVVVVVVVIRILCLGTQLINTNSKTLLHFLHNHYNDLYILFIHSACPFGVF